LGGVWRFSDCTSVYQAKFDHFVAYQDPVSNDTTTPEYLPSAMGKAIRLRGRKNINLDGIPVDFWSRNQWSVMALIKFTDEGLNFQKEIPVIGAGVTQHEKGFHLGLKSQVCVGTISKFVKQIRVEFNIISRALCASCIVLVSRVSRVVRRVSCMLFLGYD
jgi:hypothetical protein